MAITVQVASARPNLMPFALGYSAARLRNSAASPTQPAARCIPPAGSPADASRLFFSKLALADLVE